MSDEIKNKTITGVKWAAILTVAAIPLKYLLTLLLGRSGPEILGAYSALQIFLQLLGAFILFSGTAVLSNFIPKLRGDTRATFIVTYCIIILASTLLFMSVIILFPSVFDFLFKGKTSGSLFVFLLIFIPIYVFFTLVKHALYGLLEIKKASILNIVNIVGLLPIVAGSIFFFTTAFKQHYFMIMVVSYMLLNLLGLVYSARLLIRRIDFRKARGFYLPDGFWRFAVTLQVGTLFAFGFANIDRIFVLKLGDLNQLGLYQAVISIWMLIDFLPQVLLRVLVPMFSSYIARSDHQAVKRSFELMVRYCVLVSICLGLCVICFSKELLALFGPDYVHNYYLLVLLAAGSSFASLQYINYPLLVSTEKNAARLTSSTIRMAVQLFLSFVLLGPFGIAGIVIARVVALLIGQIIPIYVTIYKLPYDLSVPREFIAGIVVTVLVAALYYFVDLTSIIAVVFVFLAAQGVFLKLAGYKLQDITYLYALIVRRKLAA